MKLYFSILFQSLIVCEALERTRVKDLPDFQHIRVRHFQIINLTINQFFVKVHKLIQLIILKYLLILLFLYILNVTQYKAQKPLNVRATVKIVRLNVVCDMNGREGDRK